MGSDSTSRLGTMTRLLAVVGSFLVVLAPPVLAGDPGKILLGDVQVLTLKDGKMTTGRRSPPVPQLSCVGGSASGEFRPPVVQCYNRGWDGIDVQWECKADMDNLYRFGSVEVVCEGYDYPDDTYITRGSCGLEYTLEHTQEGRQKRGYGNNQHQGWNFFASQQDSRAQAGEGVFGSSRQVWKWKGLYDLAFFIGTAAFMYAIYRFCLASNGNIGDRQYSSTNDDYPAGGGGGGGWFNPGGRDNDDLRRRQNYTNEGDASCGSGRYQRGTGAGSAGGGFWSGLAAGGLLGYLFSGNRNAGAQYGYNRPRAYGYSGWGQGDGTGGFGTSGSSSFSSSSSGTRTASGFGGTRRR